MNRSRRSDSPRERNAPPMDTARSDVSADASHIAARRRPLIRRAIVAIAGAVVLLATLTIPTAPASAVVGEPGARGFDTHAAGSVVPQAAGIAPGQSVAIALNRRVTVPGGSVQVWTHVITDSVQEDPQAAAAENGPLAATAAVRCWQHHKNIRATNAGVTVYRWQHLVRWCFKNGKPYKVQANQGNNLGTGSFWHWRGNSRSDATKSSTAFYRYKQGHYQLCWPQPVGCFQNGYPAHSASYRAGGVVANQRTWVR